MSAWEQSVKNRLGLIHTDISNLRKDIADIKVFLISRMDTHLYITWGGMIAGFLGMAALMAKGFGWL